MSRTAGGVSIAKLQNARHDVSRRGLLVAPSTFVHPHLYVADVPGRPLLLIHSVAAAVPACPRRRRLGLDLAAWTFRPLPLGH